MPTHLQYEVSAASPPSPRLRKAGRLRTPCAFSRPGTPAVSPSPRSQLASGLIVIHATTYAHDTLGRPLAPTDSRAGTTSYDENDDDLAEATSPGDTTTWHYDSAGRLAAKEDAQVRHADYRHTETGRLGCRQWPRYAHYG